MPEAPHLQQPENRSALEIQHFMALVEELGVIFSRHGGGTLRALSVGRSEGGAHVFCPKSQLHSHPSIGEAFGPVHTGRGSTFAAQICTQIL